MNKLQNELRDKVISLFIDKIVKLSNEIKELKEENEILRNNLINCLKNVFVLKDAMSIHMPLTKIFYKQSDRIKSSIFANTSQSFHSILKKEPFIPIVVNQRESRTERTVSSYTTKSKPKSKPKYDKQNLTTSKKKEFKSNEISMSNSSRGFNENLLLPAYHSKFSNCSFKTSKISERISERTSEQKSSILDISISTNQNIRMKSKSKEKKNQKEYLNNRKRNYSMPKLPLNMLIKL